MKKSAPLFLFLIALFGGGYFFRGPLAEFVKQLPQGNGSVYQTSTQVPPPRGNASIRIASFNIQVFGDAKINNPAVMPIIVDVLKNFDLIAIQEIRAQQDVCQQLVAMLNADGKFRYDYVVGPRLGRSSSKEQYAYIYDLASIEIDRNQLYTVNDRNDLLHREPLVGWFRARGPQPGEAFTFTLVNVHTDPDEVDRELDALADAFIAVRDDQRQEDDVVMLGDFNAHNAKLGRLGLLPNLVCVVNNKPTNTRGDKQYDNILFSRVATTEFVGRGGVFDFLRHYNLTLEQALEVSDHLPVWAEFSVYEGGRPAHLATAPNSPKF
ncbi:Endonuclease/Exonuclease/phosphatase family protein [Anatilimnocola aggregata]|uniref:Endonuclease/Exonuclease/phosphatase family protein n=1 Tax=Anatilimnocola aggregata TaxID=2528021 RepID=A0A517Y9D2_9BACT|nr:endonuclease/exonuclease/phosphatase family protein [Anatilimnocola aggregata]QDU26838.1 Endonuclease/Exonuclease/phosphatase family protein [Anatilimnocola aggregata]